MGRSRNGRLALHRPRWPPGKYNGAKAPSREEPNGPEPERSPIVAPTGEPGVVKTAPRLPDGTPFPTLYYLTIAYRCPNR